MIKVNGETSDYRPENLSQLLERQNFDGRTVAVEQNGDIIPREQWDSQGVNDGDVIEIISFMGGG